MTLSDERLHLVMDLRFAGDLQRALELIRELNHESPEDDFVTGLMASILHELHHDDEALVLYESLTKRAPDSELASIGLFHTLISLQRVDDAFDEMRRYLAQHDSDLYDAFLRDMEDEPE